jgi:hypothetical protein
MTQFESAVSQARSGQLQTPKVFDGNQEVDYFGYQINIHIFQMKMFAFGFEVRGVTPKQIKDYYGLTARKNKDALAQLEKIRDKYKEERGY